MAGVVWAYCIELEEPVTITSARRKFLAMNPRPPKLTFICGDHHCFAKKVPIAGANYQENAENSVKLRTAYFRNYPQKLEKNRHVPGCRWVALAPEEDENGFLPGETHEQARKRRARRKAHDFVDWFVPTDDEKEATASGISPLEQEGAGRSSTPSSPWRGGASSIPGITKTSDFERLVESYLEIKDKFTDEEFAGAELRVSGIGTILYEEYFRHVRYCSTKTINRVIFGEVKADAVRDYNDGFRLTFDDKVEGRPVSLYVSPDMIRAYKYRDSLKDQLSKARAAQFFTVYALGHIEPAPPPYRSWNLKVSRLHNLVIFPSLADD